MSNKSLSSINIPKYLLEKLLKASIFSVKDLLSKNSFDLVKLLNVSLSRAEYLLEVAFNSLNEIHFVSVDNLLENEYESTRLSSVKSEVSDSFDKMVEENQLLKKGILVEICGPSGVGKTQFLIQMCAWFLQQNKSESVVFIDTENNLNANRIIEIIQTFCSFDSESSRDRQESIEKKIEELSKRIFIYKIFTIHEFELVLDSLEQQIIQHKTSLILIDSIASVVRKEFSGTDSNTLHERAMFLSKTSNRLKLIAQLLDVSLLVAKSPLVPFKKYFYSINKSFGISFEENSELFKGGNPSFHLIRTKPYSNVAQVI